MEYLLTSRTVKDEQGFERIFHYSVLVDQVETGSFFCENYGVAVREEDGEQVLIRGITTSAVRIDELITLLTEHNVGPAGVRDIINDWL